MLLKLSRERKMITELVAVNDFKKKVCFDESEGE